MSSLIAIVKSVVGQVFALSPEGIQRLLIEGDRLFKGDEIITGSAGMVSLALADGRIIDLGRDTQWQAPAEEPKSQEGNAEGKTVDELQQAIAAGVDPTEALDSSAAGPGATAGLSEGGGTSGGHSFIQLAETAERLDPSIGFPTQGLGFIAGSEREELGLDRQRSDAQGSTTVLPPAAPPSLAIPDTDGAANASDSTLSEAAGASAGSFTVSAEAGIASISVGGTTVSATQLANLGTTPIIINTGEGSLTLTGFNATTGVVSYSYDPSVLSHSASAPFIDSITIVVTDTNGVAGNDTLNIAITDSLPVAVNDSASLNEDAAPNTVSGTVLSNDTVGADSNATPVTAGTFTLAHGTLVLNADGSYVYTLNNADAAVNALNNGQSLLDSFTYTLTDGDGSSTTATLVITINGAEDAPVIAGVVVGAVAEDGAATASGSLSISDVD
ncbi:retention module-containing protein, partial [Pseudomonas sp. 2FG]|uniref:retention module-containing protein n=1 Tax=Pseudomonas sp. 2FG TaxID=2502191 RepID=UPI0010F4A36C